MPIPASNQSGLILSALQLTQRRLTTACPSTLFSGRDGSCFFFTRQLSLLGYRKTYFRFNPPSDLGKIDLAEYERGVEMETVTTAYLGQPETMGLMGECVDCIQRLEAC
jgi:hypothetical protein